MIDRKKETDRAGPRGGVYRGGTESQRLQSSDARREREFSIFYNLNF